MHHRVKDWFAKAGINPEDYVGRDPSRNEGLVREGFTAKAKRHIGRLPMAVEAVAMYFCLLDARTPMWVKATVAAALAYFIMPADAIPDFLPVVGFGDDAGVLTAALTAVASHLTDGHRAQAEAWLARERLDPDSSAARP